MQPEDDDNMDLLADADEFLKDDIAALEELITKAKTEKTDRVFLELAIKAKNLAELYFEGLEGVSEPYLKYKKMAAENYLLVSKKTNFAQAKLMAILMYIQAQDPKKAKKLIEEIVKEREKVGSKKKKTDDIDGVVLEICIDILHDNAKKALERVNKGIYDIDADVKDEIIKTLKRSLELT
jgi:hypothetical protein